jgi:hypothetical protein
MGSSNSKSKKQAKATSTTTPSTVAAATNNTTTTTAPATNNMSASSAQAPKPEQVPNTGADASRTAKDSSKTANYFELIEVSTHHYLSLWVDTDKQNRRTYYALSNKSTLSNEQITELVGKAVKFGPTSFNMQQNRAIIVTGEKHRQIWDIIIESQKGADPCTSFLLFHQKSS